MKKKILCFILALCLIIPTVVCFSGCSDQSEYSVSIQTNMDEHCTIYGEGNYTKGSKITVAVVPDEGYEFVGWKGNLGPYIREISVNSDIELEATIQPTSKVYLDKVELWIEETSLGSLEAKTISLNHFSLTSNASLITYFNVLNGTKYNIPGVKLVEYNDSIERHDWYVTNLFPLKFNTSRSSENYFVKDQAKTISFILRLNCSSLYIDKDGNAHYTEDSTLNHYINITGQDIDLCANSTTLNQTLTLYTDVNHGYKVMAKFSYVEL